MAKFEIDWKSLGLEAGVQAALTWLTQGHSLQQASVNGISQGISALAGDFADHKLKDKLLVWTKEGPESTVDMVRMYGLSPAVTGLMYAYVCPTVVNKMVASVVKPVAGAVDDVARGVGGRTVTGGAGRAAPPKKQLLMTAAAIDAGTHFYMNNYRAGGQAGTDSPTPIPDMGDVTQNPLVSP